VKKFASNYLFLFLLVLPFLEGGFARDIILFEDDDPVLHYSEKFNEAEPGDVLSFDDGKIKFKIIKYLDHGGTTNVLHVQQIKPFKKKHMALRMPLDDWKSAKYLTSYKKGQRELKNSGIRVPKIYNYLYEQFLAVELFEPAFDFEDFATMNKKVPKHMVKEAEQAYYRFMKSASGFEIIGDFKPEQLLYDPNIKEWVLLDFTNGHSQVPLFKDITTTETKLLDKLFYLPHESEELRYTISTQRRFKNSEWAQKLYDNSKQIILEHRTTLAKIKIRCFNNVITNFFK
jgi:hypothetical protein